MAATKKMSASEAKDLRDKLNVLTAQRDTLDLQITPIKQRLANSMKPGECEPPPPPEG